MTIHAWDRYAGYDPIRRLDVPRIDHSQCAARRCRAGRVTQSPLCFAHAHAVGIPTAVFGSAREIAQRLEDAGL